MWLILFSLKWGKEAQFNLCLHGHIKVDVLIHSYTSTSNAVNEWINGHVLNFNFCATEKSEFLYGIAGFQRSSGVSVNLDKRCLSFSPVFIAMWFMHM